MEDEKMVFNEKDITATEPENIPPWEGRLRPRKQVRVRTPDT